MCAINCFTKPKKTTNVDTSRMLKGSVGVFLFPWHELIFRIPMNLTGDFYPSYKAENSDFNPETFQCAENTVSKIGSSLFCVETGVKAG
jgi:hypothetical protein